MRFELCYKGVAFSDARDFYGDSALIVRRRGLRGPELGTGQAAEAWQRLPTHLVNHFPIGASGNGYPHPPVFFVSISAITIYMRETYKHINP